MNEFVLGALDKGKIDLEVSTGKNTTPLVAEEVKFTTDSTLEGHVKSAIDNFSKIIAEHELIVCPLILLSRFKTHSSPSRPDCAIQRMR